AQAAAEAKAKAEAKAATEAKAAEEKAAAKAEAEAKAAEAAKAKAEAEAKAAQAAAEAKAKAEAKAATEAKAAEEKAAAKAEADAKAAEAAKAKAEATAAEEKAAEAEPKANAGEETPEPAAADGGVAPQEAPAADDETRTGGAGGNTDAEGEAEANPAPAPAKAPQAPAPQVTATPLAKVRSTAPALATAYKAATATLKKTDLTGTRAKLYLVLDRSASMRPYYKDGSAQALADQTLALAAHLDPASTVHVVFFSTEVDGTTDLTLTPGHETKIDDTHAGLGRMGRTSYHAAVEAVLTHYEKNETPGTPALVVFQTDGAPDAKTPATQSLTEAAEKHPTVFFSFVAFGEHDNKAFDYLRRLKTGNTSFFHAGPTPRELTDGELYEGVLADWRP
ncbi:VWA domain-containing protein, partial [Streptomyces sp900105245]|uniref:VWA domain-containing protein n=1 Tax=Streptomyces sp. 900105245 TaxID=3154379 RepID=UPI00332152DD